MIDIAEEMGKLFYQNICCKEFVNEKNLDMIEFLNTEAENEKENEEEINLNTKKDSLIRIASCIGFIDLFEKKILEKNLTEGEMLGEINKLKNIKIEKVISLFGVNWSNVHFIEK